MTAVDRVAELLKARGHRVFTLEATSGGLVSAALLSTSGASSWFIGGSVVYSGRGAKRQLPADVLQASGLMLRDENYSGKEPYVKSKVLFTEVVAREMRQRYKADWFVAESGTTGPTFYIPGVERGFTAVSVCGPDAFQRTKVLETSPNMSRGDNMRLFCDFALELFADSLEEYNREHPPPRSARL